MTLVRLSSIRKYFPSTATLAVDDADFQLEAGEVHALVGENGAGKSTLARILCGFTAPDAGSMLVRGSQVKFASHRDAERVGIGFVPQYSMLADGLSAADNMALGHEPRRLGLFVDRRRSEYEFSILADRHGFSVDPKALVKDLSASARREVEILRALSRGGNVLVLDEPTSILGEAETESLFALIRRLKKAGTGIVYISHRAREILDLADRISVMRSGAVERTIDAGDIDECGLADLIVKSSACPAGPQAASSIGEPVLQMHDVSVSGLGDDSLSGIELCVRSGEIVSVLALGGNGLEALERVAVGIARPDHGDVLVQGKDIASYPASRLRSGIMAYIPTDREGAGLCSKASVASNAVAGRLWDYSFAQYARGHKPLDDAERMLDSFGVNKWKKRRVDTLSGGNRQRTVAARELSRPASIVVASNPAQGLDGASRAMLFARLTAMRDEGTAVLVLSSDPADAAELADRSFTLYRGRLSGLAGNSSDASSLASALTGAKRR